jgi:hypothetical protein
LVSRSRCHGNLRLFSPNDLISRAKSKRKVIKYHSKHMSINDI